MSKTILAAIDNSAACSPVLAHARLLAATLDADLCAVCVGERDEAPGLEEVASWKEAGLYVVPGDPVEKLLDAAAHSEVLAVVTGRNDVPDACRFGHVSRGLATRLAKPLLVVPPLASVTPMLVRMLIPLEGTGATTEPIAALLRDLGSAGAHVEAVLLHVFTTNNMPRFADHQPHATDAWVQAFLTRFAPTRRPGRGIVMRVGSRENVSAIADEAHADVVVVSWAQHLAEGHAPVVWSLLQHPTRPVLLVPETYRGWRDDAEARSLPFHAQVA